MDFIDFTDFTDSLPDRPSQRRDDIVDQDGRASITSFDAGKSRINLKVDNGLYMATP